MSAVLADTSVWIDFLRGRDSPPVRVLTTLLGDGLVCVNGLIKTEVLSGAGSAAEYRSLADCFSALEVLPDPPGMWDRLAVARYRLARRGLQAGVADLIVADAACRHRKPLLTLDRDFERIKGVMALELLKV